MLGDCPLTPAGRETICVRVVYAITISKSAWSEVGIMIFYGLICLWICNHIVYCDKKKVHRGQQSL